MQCAELSRSELDLTILGQISALLSDDPNTKSHRQETPRRRSSMAFYQRGPCMQDDVSEAAWNRYALIILLQ